MSLCPRCGKWSESDFCPDCGADLRANRISGRHRSGAPARSLWGFIISLVSGILVLLNAGLLLAWQFYGGSFLWANIFFWICKIDGYSCPLPSGSTATGNITFMIGAVIGLFMIVGSIMMILGYGPIGSIVVFPMSVFSLVIGGGFIAGFVLGIIGGIMGMMEQSHKTRREIHVAQLRVCLTCGSENPARNSYCGDCGRSLGNETRTY
jgi:ribosomal protein L40E